MRELIKWKKEVYPGFIQAGVISEGDVLSDVSDDDDEEGNGEYEPTLEGTADPAFISYIVAYD